ncbi:MAG: trypsin-like serine protease [Methylobacteriaceae bacterium]|nr:trypsin-like serine protease [Methylobacteriaceae bacterium]
MPPRSRALARLAAFAVVLAGTLPARAIEGGTLARPDRLTRATVGVGTIIQGEDRISVNRCTGSLIAPDLVLTAGHCVRDNPLASAVVLYDGSRALRPPIPVAAVARYDVVASDDLPAEYGSLVQLSLDTAVLRLAAPVRGRQPLRLARSTRPPAALRVAGSGLSSEGTGTLKTTRLVPLAYTSTGLLIARTGGSEICSGDSGGPVVADGPAGPVLWGVASAVLTRNPPCGRVVVVAPAAPLF